MITIVIGLLTILWTFVLVPLAGLLNLDAIKKVSPRLVEFLEYHPIGKSLIQTGLPTLALSLLTVAVPFLYDCKSIALARDDSNTCRALESARNDFPRRCGYLRHIQELLLHLLQLVCGFYNLWNRFELLWLH
jgi:hypothetical protein